MDQIINTREDLDAAQGTTSYDTFMAYLKGSMSRKQNTAVYPEGYGQPGYTGDIIEPIWVDVEDLSTIERFGFIKADFS
ncbi:MAG: hypothetical protein B7X61_15830 [Gallionellales bacterium 39-52-133]|jgi:hypothetical protein|nr:MAG: hypothetical protein B7X61_15830 [Gallionellales bacterium 39-52-133]